MPNCDGSFYWHFSNRQELLDALLAYWEREMTDMAIVKVREANTTSEERILLLMETVMVGNIARYDLPVWHRGVVFLYAEIFTRIVGHLHHFSRDRVRSRGPDATSGRTKGYGSASVIDPSWSYV
jgi:AcrR family transcriptional regulator